MKTKSVLSKKASSARLEKAIRTALRSLGVNSPSRKLQKAVAKVSSKLASRARKQLKKLQSESRKTIKTVKKRIRRP